MTDTAPAQLFAPEDVVVDLDGTNADVLYAMRAEFFFTPNEDGTPSNNGKAVFHTQWWHYSGTMKRGESMGPRVESTVEELLAEVYDTPLGPISAAHIVLGIKAAYTRRARQQLGLDLPLLAKDTHE
ncbi:hypothetical protein [Luteimonas terrae]|uniref:Uncharacterized protein n=1 Tax=Luteimonas terrae TaxID=1530191 RepID=A0ABU1XX68_9GAMM|nr:hypothetical protein [Luteimonas terrae]MDR7193359.1 hypothetical protein [Luteimonas terrae]